MRLMRFSVSILITLSALTGCDKDTPADPVDTSVQDLSDGDNDGVTVEDGDCDDADANSYPGAQDSVGDGIDQNCDGTDGVDEDGDGWASVVSGGEDCDDSDFDTNPDAQDSFGDGGDQNCDGSDGTDSDGDGTASQASGGDDCNDNDATVYVGAADPYGDGADQNCDGIDGVDSDGDGWASSAGGGEDCDDSDPTAYPAVAQMEPLLCTHDADGDGYGDANALAPLDAGTDCDDADVAEYPGANEYCDGDDDDCDGEIDEPASVDAYTWYADGDADGYGDAALSQVDCYPISGYVLDASDCDDGDAATYPGADEYCDGADDDCDGDIDEDDSVDVSTWYADADSDGYGDSSVSDVDCDQPTGYVSDSSDCDDSDATLTPEDNDADGYSTCDDDCDDTDASLEPADIDGDGYSTCDGDCDDSDASLELDDADGDGYSTCDDDCDDSDSSLYPGACYQDYDVYIGYSDLVNLGSNCSTGNDEYNGCNGGDIGFEWTDSEGGVPTSIEVQFYRGINCNTSTVSAYTELNSVYSGSVSITADTCQCIPQPEVASLTLTDISGFTPSGTNTFMIEAVDQYNCDGLSENSSWGAYAIVSVYF